VALVVAIQVLPGALTAPFLSALSDRFRRERVMSLAELARAGAVALAAAAAWEHEPVGFVYLLAAVLAVASSMFYPARRSLVPLLIRAPVQLTSTNVVSVVLQSVGLIVGPLVAGVVLALTGQLHWLFAVASIAFLVSSLSAARIGRTDIVRLSVGDRPGLRVAASGFRAAMRDRATRLLLSLFVVKNIGRGALNVPIIAVPLQLLHLANVSVALLSAALGVGGLLAGTVGGLVHRRRLGRMMAVGLLLWGAPLLVVSATPSTVIAFACMVVLGLGNALVDATGYTLLVRSVRDDVLARVYGVHETLRALAISVGSLATAVVVTSVGVRAALLGAGLVVCIAPLMAAARLFRMDRDAVVPTAELRALRRSPVFEHLLPVSLERLASRLARFELPPGTDVVREGELGDAMYVIDAGNATVISQGLTVRSLGPGDHFGEIALLHDVPRTATVRAVTAVTLYAIDRDEFIAACGHPLSASAAATGARVRLRELQALGDRLGAAATPPG
jgi:MFS family permease